MIDFTWIQATIETTCISFVIYLYFVCKYKVSIYDKTYVTLNKWLLCVSLFLVIFVCVDDDWFHYQQMVWQYDFSAGARNHGELIYGIITKIVNRNYLLFRIIIWGGALLLTKDFFKRFEINVNLGLYFLITVFLLIFNYSRTSLALAFYFYGISYLIKPIHQHSIISIIIALPLILLAYVFHSSCLVLILLTPCIYLPINNKYIIILLIALIPTVGYVLGDYLQLFLVSEDLADNEYLLDRMNSYSDRVSEKANISGLISNVIQYGAFYLPYIVILISMVKNRRIIGSPYLKLFRITTCIIFSSLAFLFLGLDNEVFFYRFLFMTLLPITALTVFLYTQGLIGRMIFKFCVAWGVVSNFWRILYIIYKLLNGSYILS